MTIAIIGGGITGLTAAYRLGQAGHTVTIFEAEKVLGGLAIGWKEKDWSWHLEKAYHHLFTNDESILSLLRKLGLSDDILVRRPITAVLWHDNTYQFDSPLHLLQFPGLPLFDRLRTGAFIAALKVLPFWQPLEHYTAKSFFETFGGSAGWEVIWKPLMTGKFSKYYDTVAASWLWARIKKRTPSLCYIRGGFQHFIQTLSRAVSESGATIHIGTPVTSIKTHKGKWEISWATKKEIFDTVLMTAPTPIAAKLIPELPASWVKPFLAIPHLHAQLLVLETKEPILDKIYWLNINDRSFPFLAAVAHTNFIEPHYYGDHHLTYFGNYLPMDHKYLSFTKEQLLTEFLPFIKKLAHDPNFQILKSYSFVGPFAQPVHEREYSKRAPPLVTPLPNLFLANMDSIYPWDRGTNYAVELGQTAAKKILEEIK